MAYIPDFRVNIIEILQGLSSVCIRGALKSYKMPGVGILCP